MKIQEIFDLAIKMGTEADLRGPKEVEKFLGRKKKKYEALSEREKDEKRGTNQRTYEFH